MAKLRDRQKKEAVKRMKKLRMMEPSIKEFEEEGKLNLSESIGFLYWLDEKEQQMVNDFEEQNNGLVYHVIKSHTNIGLLYSLLYVSKYTDEWRIDQEDLDVGEAMAYVVNVTMPDCSEFGTIGIKPSIGGLVRVW